MQKTDSPANNNFAMKADILLFHCLFANGQRCYFGAVIFH